MEFQLHEMFNATAFPNVDPAKIRDTVGFMVNVSYLGKLQQRLTTRPGLWTGVRASEHSWWMIRRTRGTLIQSGRGTPRCASLKTWQRDLSDFRTRCTRVKQDLARLLHNFGCAQRSDGLWSVCIGRRGSETSISDFKVVSMCTCQAGLGKAFAQFRVRSTINGLWSVCIGKVADDTR